MSSNPPKEKKSGLADSIIIPAVIALILTAPVNGNSADFNPGKAGFRVRILELEMPYSLMSLFIMPGEKLKISIAKDNQQGMYSITCPSGDAVTLSNYSWQWQAPVENGIYRFKIKHEDSNDSIMLNLFVMIPHAEKKGEWLNGYRIGSYPKFPLKQLPIYNPPAGFIEVTEENLETWISPHFQLKQFLCKQESGFPKYLVLRDRLLLKLEFILEKINEAGYSCQTLHIMSGYRTPYYNYSIGNVKYSRHLWGGAADIFIDEEPQDDMMDDLNKDGITNWKDAAIIYDIIDNLFKHPFYENLIGGLARYKKTNNHGPFVHIDVRGRRARWGD